MDLTKHLGDEQLSAIDRHILSCDQTAAYWLVREFTGAGPEEAQEFVRGRFRELRTALPDRFAWSRFPCEDYLASEWADTGCWDEDAQFMLTVPTWDVKVRSDIDFLAIGGPGVDGIEWGYRRGHPGLWAHYPIRHEFVPAAATVTGLIEGWLSGDLQL